MAVWSIPNPIIGNREPSALGNGGTDTTFDDHAANRFSAASNLAGSIFDTSTPASTAALATWRPSFAAGSVGARVDRKSTRLNSSHSQISYAVVCLKKKKQ